VAEGVERDSGGQLISRVEPPPADHPAAGVLHAVVASAGFGFLGIFTKVAYANGAGVAAVVAGRSVFMLPMLGVLRSPRRRTQALAAWPELTAMAALMVFNALTYFLAISRMSPAAVTLVIYLYPTIVIAASWGLGRARPRAAGLLAAALSLTGVAIVLGRPEGVDAAGTLCAAANALGYAGYLLVSERAVRRADPVTAYGVSGGVAGAILLAGGSVVALAGTGGGGLGGPHGMAAIAAAGLISTVAAGALQLVAVRRLGSAPTALINCLEIVVVVVASAVVFGDPMTVSLVTGALLVSAGAALAPSVLRRTPALGHA
jgi:drug/metabolite transporter (DMT)-like permease